MELKEIDPLSKISSADLPQVSFEERPAAARGTGAPGWSHVETEKIYPPGEQIGFTTWFGKRSLTAPGISLSDGGTECESPVTIVFIGIIYCRRSRAFTLSGMKEVRLGTK